MRHRIFIAINLQEDIKKKLADYQNKWPELPCRWTKKENLHITLEFLGYLTDEEILEAIEKTKETASKQEPYFIALNKIVYGPPQKPPRMVWAIGDKIREFNLSPHLTLGRLRQWEFNKMEIEERPEINEEINLTFEVNSIEVMESELKRTGPKYIILESCPLTPLEIPE